MSRVITAAGVGLMAILLIGSFIRTGQKPAAGGHISSIAPSATAASTLAGGDNIQRVTLGFGRFNYEPDTIRVRRGVPVELTADRTVTGCFSTFVIPELNIGKRFTATDRTLTFTPKRAGTFRFSCAMGMGSGRLIVEG